MWEQSSRPRGSREPCAYRLLIGPVTLATIIAGLRPIADPSGVRRSFPAPWRVWTSPLGLEGLLTSPGTPGGKDGGEANPTELHEGVQEAGSEAAAGRRQGAVGGGEGA